MSQEIADTLMEMENCFQLLMPDPFDFTVNDMELEPNEQMSAHADRPAPPSSSQVEVNQSCFGCMDDEQPCCSKDVLSVSQCVRTGENKDLDEKQETPEQKETDGGMCSEVQSGVPAPVDDDYQTFVRNHGLISHKYTLDLEISTGTKNFSNFSRIDGDSLCLKCFIVVCFGFFFCDFSAEIPGHHFYLWFLDSSLIYFGVLFYFRFIW